jgi:AbrB family looped-hinge helix DNA binding protein
VKLIEAASEGVKPMTILKVSKKGTITIPADIRRRYHLDPGSLLVIVDYAGRLSLVPAVKDPIKHGRGLLKGGPSLTDALLTEHAKELEREG